MNPSVVADILCISQQVKATCISPPTTTLPSHYLIAVHETKQFQQTLVLTVRQFNRVCSLGWFTVNHGFKDMRTANRQNKLVSWNHFLAITFNVTRRNHKLNITEEIVVEHKLSSFSDGRSLFASFRQRVACFLDAQVLTKIRMAQCHSLNVSKRNRPAGRAKFASQILRCIA